jgi:hypothetical protein
MKNAQRFSAAAIAVLFALSAASLAFAGPDLHLGPFHDNTVDNGSCGQPWANISFDRDFHIHPNGDGTFRVTEQFKKGSFVTIDGPSPGSCSNVGNHGSHIRAGVEGKFQGYIEGTVSGGGFNPNGCETGDCTTTAGFITAVFGPTATFSCFSGGDCRFNFEYTAGGQGLQFHNWSDSSGNNGNEIFRGDIADQ